MQESFISYLPKNYIKDREIHQENVCTICLELKLTIARCRGPCKKPICSGCFAKIKGEKDICPSRCSTPFEIEPIPSLNLLLSCPYQPTLCKQIIRTAEQFRKHCQQCNFMSQEQKKQSEHQQQYRCQKNHLLIFLTDKNYEKVFINTELSFYKHTCREICSICHEQSNIRSICLQCSSKDKLVEFCVTCRPLPCSKKLCPIGHQVQVQQKMGFAMICDFCGEPAKFNGKFAYEDSLCNYDICQKCYDNLPQENPLIPLQNAIPASWNNLYEQNNAKMAKDFIQMMQNYRNYVDQQHQYHDILRQLQEEQIEFNSVFNFNHLQQHLEQNILPQEAESNINQHEQA